VEFRETGSLSWGTEKLTRPSGLKAERDRRVQKYRSVTYIARTKVRAASNINTPRWVKYWNIQFDRSNRATLQHVLLSPTSSIKGVVTTKTRSAVWVSAPKRNS